VTAANEIGRNADVRASFALSRRPAGGALYVALTSRSNEDGGDGYLAKVGVSPEGRLGLSLVRVVDTVETTLASANGGNGLTVVADGSPGETGSEAFVVRLRTEGSSPTVIRAKVWGVGEPEPADWMIEATDYEPSLQVSGRAGIWTYLSRHARNEEMVVYTDNVLVLPGASAS
jgi:hypothetical protein